MHDSRFVRAVSPDPESIRLGPRARPVIDRGLALRAFDPILVYRRNCLVKEQCERMTTWRSWGFRNWRLQRMLDRQQDSAASWMTFVPGVDS